MEISYKKTALLVFGKTIKVTPEPDGTYILNKGITYTIKMRTSSGKFTVEQDNWVYAPNGGKWTAGHNKYSAVMEQMYIPSDKLMDAIKFVSPAFAEVNSNISIEKQVDLIMKVLELDDSNETLVLSALSTISAMVGGSGTIGAVLTNASKLLIVIAVGNDVYTVFGFLLDATTIFECLDAKGFRNACEKGNMNVVAYKIDNALPTWNPWITNGYINKYYLPGDKYFSIRGTVSLNPSIAEIVDYCNFKEE